MMRLASSGLPAQPISRLPEMDRRAFLADRAAARQDPALRPLTEIRVSDGYRERGGISAHVLIVLLALGAIGIGAVIAMIF